MSARMLSDRFTGSVTDAVTVTGTCWPTASVAGMSVSMTALATPEPPPVHVQS